MEREGREGDKGKEEKERWRLNMIVITFSINLVSYLNSQREGTGWAIKELSWTATSHIPCNPEAQWCMWFPQSLC